VNSARSASEPSRRTRKRLTHCAEPSSRRHDFTPSAQNDGEQDVQYSNDHRVCCRCSGCPGFLRTALKPWSKPRPAGELLPPLTYEIVRHRGHWRVLHIGRHSAPHPDQAAATAAMESARQAKTSARNVIVRLLRTDSKVIELDPASGWERYWPTIRVQAWELKLGFFVSKHCTPLGCAWSDRFLPVASRSSRFSNGRAQD